MTDEAGIPEELKEKLASFDSSLSQVESVLQPLLQCPQNELFEKLSPLDRAKVELVGGYTINSLFWMYLNVCGLNPKEHSVKQELDRIRSYMNRVKECQDKAKAPKLDKGASKRFVKSALWQAAKSKNQDSSAAKGTPSTGDEVETRMYLNVCGLNPKEHSVKQELDRIRSYMNRVKECQDKAKAPKLDKGASKRFVKSALWQAAKSKNQDSSAAKGTPSTGDEVETRMYLNVCGLNPKEHSVKQELDRIRSYMNRVKECQDKAKAPKLDKGASKRFVKSALWQAAKSKNQDSSAAKGTPSTGDEVETRMYLNVCGLNPKEHSVKQELDRIRSYMNRVKECQDKAKAPKLDKGASKRFVKSALWQAAKSKNQDSSAAKGTPSTGDEVETRMYLNVCGLNPKEHSVKQELKLKREVK
ncbi:hypothetical protein KUTeg_005138 [Tegillarca granosa]|uniref:Nuclear nucleic acid-binding protein C1D n=1 Tax=Tegillarca granosa TaxID=220873 RepID=A0ABQ9FIY8_TEGGR|nr:hypothetical protein KUTeg_005138 [Tegillarca granosa]